MAPALSIEVTFRGEAAEAIQSVAELLALPYDRVVELLALEAAELALVKAA